MAHGREGPDVVMTIRYASASDVRTVSDHELLRTPDGSSAIDPLRSHLNEVLHGPRTQQDALSKLWDDGVRKPAAQAESPYVQMVLGASPEYFRSHGQGPGEWDDSKLKVWKAETMKWLKAEYGADLAHVSLHLDEETPHMHVLVVPTYEKRSRKPQQRKKAGEPDDEYAARLAAWQADGGGSVRTAGRASSPYWSRMWARLDARKSYHASMAPLGLGYGKDFIGLNEDSPQRKATGTWVKEQAAAQAEREAELMDRKAVLDKQARQIETAKVVNQQDRRQNEALRMKLDERSADLDRREASFRKSVQLFGTLTKLIAERLGVKVANTVKLTLGNITAALSPPRPEPELSVLDQIEAARAKKSAPEEPRPEADRDDLSL